MTDLAEFLLARIAEDEAPTFELIPYECEPGCCAPAGWVGHRCLICKTVEFGGTVAAITEMAREHEEDIHRRSRVLAECEAKRRIVKDALADVRDARRRPGWTIPDAEITSDVDRAYRSGVESQKAQQLPEALDRAERLLRLLALPYVTRPGYRQEWRP